VEIAYFGLLPHAVGTGQGGALLSAAVERAWEMGASRVYVNTCTLDHPRALENYQKRGFRLFREETRTRSI
jgi:GNAT superfamily N-acetyltransferase